MPRQLNPEVFNPAGKNLESTQPSSSVQIFLRELQKELKQNKKQISELESMVELFQNQIKTLAENEEKKTSAFSKAITELEESFNKEKLSKEEKLKQINLRLKDRELVNEQIQTLVERFNTNISQFENQLTSLKNTLSEKHISLMNFREIIDQLVNDVEKLKYDVKKDS